MPLILIRSTFTRLQVKHIARGFVIALILIGATDARADDEYSIGQTLSGTFDFFGVPMSLPAGSFEVAYFHEKTIRTNRSGNYEWKRLYLIKRDGEKVFQIVGIVLSTSPLRGGFWKFKGCEHKKFLFSEVLSNKETGDQDCWNVAPEAINDDWDAGEEIVEYADDQSLALSAAMLFSRFHFADRGAFLTIEQGVSPDILLAPPADKPYWLYEDWTPENVTGDMSKEAVVNVLKKRGIQQYQRIKTVFENL